MPFIGASHLGARHALLGQLSHSPPKSLRSLYHCRRADTGRSIGGMEIARQLSIFLANKPGTLAKVCEELARQKINIYALSISDTSDHSVIRMVVSDTQKALHLLGERGVLVVENKVLMLENANTPGTMGGIAHLLAKAKINIEYAYLASSPNHDTGLAIVRVSDTKRAMKLLLGLKKKKK